MPRNPITKVSPQQKLFCRELAAGKSQTEAYQAAYPNASRQTAQSRSSELVAMPLIRSEISRFTRQTENEAALTITEKRLFLARVARRGKPFDSNGELMPEFWEQVEGYDETIDRDGNVHRKIRFFTKSKAIELDNKLSGDEKPIKAEFSLKVLLANIPPSTLPPGKSVRGQVIDE